VTYQRLEFSCVKVVKDVDYGSMDILKFAVDNCIENSNTNDDFLLNIDKYWLVEKQQQQQQQTQQKTQRKNITDVFLEREEYMRKYSESIISKQFVKDNNKTLKHYSNILQLGQNFGIIMEQNIDLDMTVVNMTAEEGIDDTAADNIDGYSSPVISSESEASDTLYQLVTCEKQKKKRTRKSKVDDTQLKKVKKITPKKKTEKKIEGFNSIDIKRQGSVSYLCENLLKLQDHYDDDSLEPLNAFLGIIKFFMTVQQAKNGMGRRLSTPIRKRGERLRGVKLSGTTNDKKRNLLCGETSVLGTC
jgi:hypothetical protein